MLKKGAPPLYLTAELVDSAELLAKKYENIFPTPPKIKLLSIQQHPLYPDLFLLHAFHLTGSLVCTLEIKPTAPFSAITPAPSLKTELTAFHQGILQ